MLQYGASLISTMIYLYDLKLELKGNDWLPGENAGDYSLLPPSAASKKSVNLSNQNYRKTNIDFIREAVISTEYLGCSHSVTSDTVF